MSKKWWLIISSILILLYYINNNQNTPYYKPSYQSRQPTDEDLRRIYEDTVDREQYESDRYDDWLSSGGNYR